MAVLNLNKQHFSLSPFHLSFLLKGGKAGIVNDSKWKNEQLGTKREEQIVHVHIIPCTMDRTEYSQYYFSQV